MTSRVQKGGSVFRPIKARSRTDTPQQSTPTSGTESWRSSSPPVTYAPPPSSWPLDPAFSTLTDITALDHIVSHDVSTLNPTLIALNNPSAPHQSPHVISKSARSTPAPPTLITHSSPTPTSLNASLPLSPLFASRAPQPPIHLPGSHNGVITSTPTSNNTPVFHNSGASNISEPAAAIDSTVQPRDTSYDIASIDPSGSNNAINEPSASSQTSIPATVNHNKSARKGAVSRKSSRRKDKSPDVAKGNGENPEPSKTKRKRRESSSTPHSRRSRGPSLPLYDPDADPGEEIDPTVVTMASLCNDTGQGRVSRKAAEILSNHAAWKTQTREKRARMRALMELKKFGRETEADTLETSSSSKDKEASPIPEPSPSKASLENPSVVDRTGAGFDYSQNLTTSRFNVQVRIGPNGETLIDEESLVVDRAEGEDTTNYTHVVESDHTKFVNSGSYGKRYRGSRWSAEETEQFYCALAQYGENYELIAYVLPGRDRKSCKNKFKAEDKKNPARINHCLTNSIPVDMITLSRMTGKDFSGPVPEIRPPAPPIVEPTNSAEPDNQEPELDPEPDPVRKKRTTKNPTPDNDAIIVGEVDSFVHPSSDS